MSVSLRATPTLTDIPDPGRQRSAAMEAVDRAWRNQYSDLREARASAAHAIALAESNQDSHALAHALFQSAYASIRVGLPAEAARAAAECRALFESLNDDRGVWLARAAQALCVRLDGEPEKSIRLLQELASHPPADATATDLFVVHVALSLGFRYLGSLESALKWHYQAVDTARDTQDPQLLASTLCNLGGYHTDLHNPDEGCRLLEEGLELAAACDADRTTIIIAMNLAQTYTLLNRHHDALMLAKRYLTAERYILAIGVNEPEVPLTLALAYANANRPDDAALVFDGIRGQLVRRKHAVGTPHVFWCFVEARIALAADRLERATDIAQSALEELDEASVDSPSNLMGLHAIAASACERMGNFKSALEHERARATIHERLAKLAAHVASLTHKITHELDATRAERDRAMALHAELEGEHRRLAALNAALKMQIAENQRLHDELKEQNYRDALTGLHNRRYLYERGPHIVDEAIERGTPLCLVMLDLDHFKQLNDVHGHIVGDRVLVELGRLLRERLRGDDIVCRVGGEEFAMILPATTIPVARERLSAMLDDMRNLHHRDSDGNMLPANLTFSAGIAKAPDHPTSIDALMIAADRLLYRAKNDGRARIESDQYDVPFVPSATAIARQTLDQS